MTLIYGVTLAKQVSHIQLSFKFFGTQVVCEPKEVCCFMTTTLTFLDFMVYADGIVVDEERIQAFMDWLVPQSIGEVISFHGLATFYRRFIKNFIISIALVTNSVRKGEFHWAHKVEASFQLVNKILSEALILTFPISTSI